MKREKENATIEGALVDAELFIKYRMPERALKALRDIVDLYPANADLRWKLAEFCLDQQLLPLAAEQLAALAEIYIESKQFDMARSALLKAKLIHPEAAHINLRLNSLNQQQARQEAATRTTNSAQATLAGDLRYISLFDVIQALEKNQITGIVKVSSNELSGNLYFNQGLVVDAIVAEMRGKAAFKQFAEVSEGYFELEKSPVEFNPSINTPSNAQLILEIFSDEEPEQV